MKRKRRGRPKKVAAVKPAPAAPANADEEVFLNFVEQNVDENAPNGVNNNGAGQFGAAKDFSTSSSPSSSSSDGGGSYHPGWNAEPAASGRITVSVNKRGRPPINLEASMNAANAPALSSRGVGATTVPSKGKRSKAVSSRGFSSLSQKESPLVRKASQDPRYNRVELQTCLEVIKKIMRMEEAVSFCSPVDPVAQDIPDYFSVIDTPMDFGTICSNLQNEVKYLNSDDVYKDVEYIWENCTKYNKKGDYIVYLMKRVRKKFMKYWTEAGLRTEMTRRHDAPLSVHTMKQSQHEAMSVVDNMVNSNHMQEDRYGTDQPHPRVHHPSYAHPYMSHQPQLMPPYSQFHAGFGGSYPGHPYIPAPPLASHHPMEPENQAPSHPFPPKMSGPSHSQQQQPQLSSRYMWQSHQSTVQPHPSQSHFHTNASKTGHQQSLHPTDYEVTHNGYVPRSSVDPMLSSGRKPQPHPLHQSSSHYQHDWSNVPQASMVPPQSSHQGASADVSSPGIPLVDGSRRETRQMKKSSAGPENNADMERVVPRQPSVGGQEQLHKPEFSTPDKRRGGRGPTRCRFMDDLPDGQRIYVPLNPLGQPIGPEAPKLTSFVGTLARDGKLAPLDYLDWSAMPEEYKENMWQVVLTKFDVDPLCKTWFMKAVASRWRNWKAKLKADHYTPHATDEERLRDCNKRVYPDQWAALIAHWNTEEVQIRAMKNKANRAKQTSSHASGSKSFARRLEEERAKRNGKELTSTELYILTHTRKDGQPVDDVAADQIEKLREQEKRKELNSGASGDQVDANFNATGEASTPVSCPTISELYGHKPSRNSLLRVALEAKRSANEEVGKMMSKMEAMEQRYSSLETQVAKMNDNMQLLLEKMGATVSKQVTDKSPEGSQQADKHSSQKHSSQNHSSSSSYAAEVEEEEE